MDVIRKYANLCDSVTDLGHRRESVLALLASSAQYVNIYSTEAEDPIIKKARELTAHRAITIFPKEAVQQAHLVQTDIGATDLLFLDTVMTFDRVLRTLEAYAPLVAKYIVIHDTQVYIAKGEDGGPGIMAAIRIWLRSNHQWFPVYITDAEYGLTVYSRVPEDRPKLPNLARKVFNFAIHAAGHVQAGAPATPDNIMEQRLDICANCMMRNVEACSACGCPLPKKTAWADQYCDHGKWGPYQSMISTGIPLV
jgi:hypothetical protein